MKLLKKSAFLLFLIMIAGCGGGGGNSIKQQTTTPTTGLISPLGGTITTQETKPVEETPKVLPDVPTDATR